MTTAAERKPDPAGWTRVAELEAELAEWKQFVATAESEIARLRAVVEAIEKVCDEAQPGSGRRGLLFAPDIRAALRSGDPS